MHTPKLLKQVSFEKKLLTPSQDLEKTEYLVMGALTLSSELPIICGLNEPLGHTFRYPAAFHCKLEVAHIGSRTSGTRGHKDPT